MTVKYMTREETLKQIATKYETRNYTGLEELNRHLETVTQEERMKNHSADVASILLVIFTVALIVIFHHFA